MTLPPKPAYAIVSNDRTAGVQVGARVVYSLVRTNVIAPGHAGDARVAATERAITEEYSLGHPYTDDRVVQPRVRWVMLPERTFHLERAGETVGFEREFDVDRYDVSVTWERPGVHVVRCFIEPPPAWGKKVQVVTFSQVVLTAEEDAVQAEVQWSALRWMTAPASTAGTPALGVTSPEQAAMEVFRVLGLVDDLERAHPTTDPDARTTYRQVHERQTKYGTKLYELALGLDPVERRTGHRRHAIVAMHHARVDNVVLEVFVAIGREPAVSRLEGFADEGGANVQIVDWTDATDRAYSGRYGTSGGTTASALAHTLFRWKRHSRYPPGEVRFQLPPAVAEVLIDGASSGRLPAPLADRLRDELAIDVPAATSGLPLDGRFETRTPLDADAVLDGVAFASAVTASLLLFAAPVPGSRAVAALLWTSAISGAAASTVRIATRHEHDISDPMATAMDVLGIVSSLLMMPSGASIWRQGAKIALREAFVVGTGTSVLKMSLVGQIVADGLQGVLFTAEALAQITGVLGDGKLDPFERLRQVAVLLGKLAAVGALVVVGAKANVEDLERLRLDATKLRRFGDPKEDIDLPDGPGSDGTTRNGKHVDRADIDPHADPRIPARQAELTPGARAALGELDDAAKAGARRMLDADEAGANLLFERFGREALDVAVEFASVWKRWGDQGLPPHWLRLVHKHTGLHGVRYFAKLPNDAAGAVEYAAGGWACMREEHFHSLYPNAGHSVARHGPHIPDGPGEALEARVTTGMAADVAEHVLPDGTKVWQQVAAPSARSSRFLSFVDWLDAHDSAYEALMREFKGAGVEVVTDVERRGALTGPIVGKAGQSYPKAAGYVEFRDVDDPSRVISRPLGEAYEGVKDGTERTVKFRRPGGKEFEDAVYRKTRRVDPAEVTFVYSTMGWTGDEWILINLYPARRPKPKTPIKLEKQPIPGKTKL